MLSYCVGLQSLQAAPGNLSSFPTGGPSGKLLLEAFGPPWGDSFLLRLTISQPIFLHFYICERLAERGVSLTYAFVHNVFILQL